MGAIARPIALPGSANRIGLIRVQSNSQLQAAEDAQRKQAEAAQSQPEIYQLAGHIKRFWQSAQSAKQPIERQMLSALRARNGVYEPDELALIREQGGSEIFMMLTSAKCRGFEAWMREIMLPDSGEQPWGLEPTPMPDLPPNVQQAVVNSVVQMAMAAGWDVEDQRVDQYLLKVKSLAMRRLKQIAQQIANRHEMKIQDQFAEGGWEEALSDFVYDLATYPAAIIKGPVLRMAKTREWLPGPGGMWVPHITTRARPEWDRRSPFDLYPAAAMKRIGAGNFIDRHMFTRGELVELRGLPGYSTEAIDAVLMEYGDRGFSSRLMSDTQRAILEMRPNEQFDPEQNIESLNFWGSCSGKMLLDWGYKSGVDVGGIRATDEYQMEAWMCGRYIIKAQLNPDPMGERPYSVTSFEPIPDSIWGKGLPEVMRDCQKMCNSSARAVSNNMAIASGPQVEVNVDRVADGEAITKPYPWKLWQTTTDMTGNNQPAIRFFQPQANVQELLMVYDKFSSESDNVTGVPKYSYGDSRIGGAGRTSSGLAQLLGTMGKGIRRVVGFASRYVVVPNVMRTFNFNMEFDPDNTIKGDLRACVKGIAAALLKDQVAMRQREMLQATMNPLDASILGVKGRAKMLRPALSAADFDADDILPDDLELELLQASLPPPHELVGGAGPNAGSDGGMPPGMSAAGGTPGGGETTDASGAPSNGQVVRKQTLGYRHGGIVKNGGWCSDTDDEVRRITDDEVDAGV
jgi:hypothetical protein